jgi:hypothetical protein
MPFPHKNNDQNFLLQALTNMMTQGAKPSSTYVDKPYVAQQQQQRQQNAFEQAKQEDYFNKVRALNELRAQGTNPSQMFQKANNFVGDFVTGNNTQQMGENLALNAIPIGKLLSAIAPMVGATKKLPKGISNILEEWMATKDEFGNAARKGNAAIMIDGEIYRAPNGGSFHYEALDEAKSMGANINKDIIDGWVDEQGRFIQRTHGTHEEAVRDALKSGLPVPQQNIDYYGLKRK